MNRDRLILGIDLGGTKSAATLQTSGGELRYRVATSTPAQDGSDAVVATLISLARNALQAANDLGTVSGCGISVGAPADAANGVVYPAPNLPGWSPIGTPLARIVADALNLPTCLENDADATALAEWRFGAGRGAETMAFLTQGTGIGSGLVLNGRLHRGAFGAGGEIGHICVDTSDEARVCSCGLCGCLEAYASGPSVVRIAAENGYRGEQSGAAVAEAARGGDAAALAAFALAADKLGRGLAVLVMLLNPERIVLGTLAIHAGDLLLTGTESSLRRHAWKRLTEDLTVVPAQLGDRAQDLAALCAYLSRADESNGTMSQ
ncbi:MAG: ROK family protein [Akkermansiaceae bacterium]|nr:ROK family protein [Armatimonadota bacterium]